MLSEAGCYKIIEPGKKRGAVAQLGARLDGIEEVTGSNPVGSTNLSNALYLWVLYQMYPRVKKTEAL